MEKSKRDPQGRWRNGISGNPSGRPVGSRNRSTVLMESLLMENAVKLIRKAIRLALKGDPIALKLCMERLLPVCKDRLIHLDLSQLESSFRSRQISDVGEAILDAIAAGEIAPSEGQLLANILIALSQIARTEQEMELKEEDRWKN
jgi:uncharacterized protein DUF5681